MDPGAVDAMFERFTDHTKRALFLARYEASVAADAVIDRPHLLRALLTEPDPGLTDLFGRMNLAHEAIRDAVLPWREKLRTGPMHEEGLVFSDEFKQVLSLALEEADREESAALVPRHLLLGLLRSDGFKERQALNRLGIDLEAVRSDGRGGKA